MKQIKGKGKKAQRRGKGVKQAGGCTAGPKGETAGSCLELHLSSSAHILQGSPSPPIRILKMPIRANIWNQHMNSLAPTAPRGVPTFPPSPTKCTQVPVQNRFHAELCPFHGLEGPKLLCPDLYRRDLISYSTNGGAVTTGGSSGVEQAAGFGQMLLPGLQCSASIAFRLTTMRETSISP